MDPLPPDEFPVDKPSTGSAASLMFQFFQPTFDKRAAGMFLLALLISVGILGGMLGAIQAMAEAEPDAAEEELEEEVIVEFAPPTEPEEEPEPLEEEETVEPVAAAEVFRPAAARPSIAPPPDEIPDERPQESDGELAEAEDSGPTGGDIRGVVGGMGGGRATGMRPPPPPPPPPPPSMMRDGRSMRSIRTAQIRTGRPRFRCAAPPQARSQGIFGTVIVQVVVNAQGQLTRYDIQRGNPVLQEATRQCLRTNWQRWSPATLEGRPVDHTWRAPFTYRATNI